MSNNTHSSYLSDNTVISFNCQQPGMHENGYASGPERALMSALLFDGVQAYMSYLQQTRRRETGRYYEAFRWITESRTDYVFSFNNVCESLGIDPEFLRLGLINASKAQQQIMAKTRRH